MHIPDIDIDLADRDKFLKLIKHIPATIIKTDTMQKHNTGAYCHAIPFDALKNMATIGYKEAEARGYFKIDFLNNSVYEKVRDEEYLSTLLNTEPNWELLEYKEVVEELPHIGNYFNIVQKIKPRSIEDLSVVLALIRPAKKHLANKPRKEIDAEIWVKPTDKSYYFKRAHAIAYAATIVVSLNLIVEESNNV